MPLHNQFHHQSYHSGPPHAAYELLRPELPPPVDSSEYQQQLREAGELYQRGGVSAIYLLHGTFMGSDAFGWIRKLRGLWSAVGEQFELNVKGWMDSIMSDAGNYTIVFARQLEAGLARPQPAVSSCQIPVRLCIWSSENHHVGRADGAIRLLDQLLTQPPGSRILIWTHSHGGNVLALLTNLIAADAALREKFFRACRSYYKWPFTDRIHMSAWQRVIEALADPAGCAKLASMTFDIVTFGTPIRYGWDAGGYDRLLHFVNHRPQPGCEPYLAAMPRRFDDILHATGGDYIQQFGIAGSNLPPSFLSWRAGRANRRLSELVQQDLLDKQLTSRVMRGMRVADEGLTLLVDYQDAGTSFMSNLAGHAVYTRRSWMAFHALEIARRFYQPV